MTDTTTEDLLAELMRLADARCVAEAELIAAGLANRGEPAPTYYDACASARSTLESRLRAVVEDAQRYRVVRGKFSLSDWGSICIPTGHTKFTPEQTDTAIDRARKGGEPS